MKHRKIIEVPCPGCGKELHTFHIPNQPGIYRLKCQANRDKPLNIQVHEDGSLTCDQSRL